MTHWRRVAVALLLAVPIEALNILLCGIMLDPGPFPSGLLPKLLGYEWVFFHYLGFQLLLDRFNQRVFGIEAGLIAAFVLAYLQTALVLFLFLSAATWLRRRKSLPTQSLKAHLS